MASLDSIADGGNDIPLPFGFKVLVFGTLVGTMNYLSGVLINNYQGVIFKMMSFYPASGMSTKKTITTTTVDSSGSSTITK